MKIWQNNNKKMSLGISRLISNLLKKSQLHKQRPNNDSKHPIQFNINRNRIINTLIHKIKQLIK
jgi:hypothetical protein